MSTFPAPSRPRVRFADAERMRARLSLVRGRPNPAPRLPFAALVLTVLVVGLVGLLVLNTSLQQGAFYVRDLQARAQALTDHREALELQVAALREPQRVAARASAMGMVPDHSPAFLRLSDGAVLGNAKPAGGGPTAELITVPRAANTTPAQTGNAGSGPETRERQGSSR
jgi:hypothetical protein